MHLFLYGVAALLALAIIAIGALYIATPKTMTPNFGLPLPEEGANIVWWLRLKGVRDIVSGLILLAFMVWGGPHEVAIVLLVAALTPVGDMLLILASKGSVKQAFGIHAVTAAVMIATAIPLLVGAH